MVEQGRIFWTFDIQYQMLFAVHKVAFLVIIQVFQQLLQASLDHTWSLQGANSWFCRQCYLIDVAMSHPPDAPAECGVKGCTLAFLGWKLQFS